MSTVLSNDCLIGQFGITFNCRRAIIIMMMSMMAEFLPFTCLAYIVHALIVIVPSGVAPRTAHISSFPTASDTVLLCHLVLKLVQVSLQPLLILEVVLKEDLFFGLACDEGVLDGRRVDSSVFINAFQVVCTYNPLFGTTFTTDPTSNAFIAEKTGLSGI